MIGYHHRDGRDGADDDNHKTLLPRFTAATALRIMVVNTAARCTIMMVTTVTHPQTSFFSSIPTPEGNYGSFFRGAWKELDGDDVWTTKEIFLRQLNHSTLRKEVPPWPMFKSYLVRTRTDSLWHLLHHHRRRLTAFFFIFRTSEWPVGWTRALGLQCKTTRDVAEGGGSEEQGSNRRN